MTPAARISAAIEVLQDIVERRRPAADALKDWGLSRRFAGSKDRAAVASLVYDALRRKASSAYAMASDEPRALVLGMLRGLRGLARDEIAALCSGENHAPAPLSADETALLTAFSDDDAPGWVRADVPEWLWPSFERAFGAMAVEEGQALAARAPVDLRVNRLKASRETVAKELAHLQPEEGAWSPDALRFQPGHDGRGPSLQAEASFFAGGFEIQDEGSQLVTLLAGAKPGDTVVDLCAGAGGKTLALAAMMDNSGKLYATDSDKRRLAPIYERLERAGARCVEVLNPKRDGGELAPLKGRCDLVVIDAPCSGTGAWRRNPDAKWRMRPGALEQRLKQQAEVLDRAVTALKPGGRIAYITCSVLDAENGAQIRAFLARHSGFAVVPPATDCDALGATAPDFKAAAHLGAEGVLMTPRRTGTDGFFVSLLRHQG